MRALGAASGASGADFPGCVCVCVCVLGVRFFWGRDPFSGESHSKPG